MLLKNFLADELQVKKGSVKMPIKSLVDQYKERYEEMAQDTSRPFSYMVYQTTPGGRIIVHVKVPSRSLTKFYYDVLLELEPTDKATTIRDCHVKFFSNSPSFIYSYAYVFYHLDPGDSSTPKGRRSRSGMIIDTFTKKIPRDRLLMPGTEKKIGDKVLKNEPVVRNPLGLPYLDLYNNCPCIYDDEDGVNTEIANLRQSTFLADGTHPNDDGYEWLSTAYEDFLRRI